MEQTGSEAPMGALAALPDAFELTVRANDEQRWLFLLHYSAGEQSIRIGNRMEDVLSGAVAKEDERIETFGVRVLRKVKGQLGEPSLYTNRCIALQTLETPDTRLP